MATFYQGEQLVQVVSIDSTYNDLDSGEYPVIYTVPTGYYGFLKFAHIGSLSSYPSSSVDAYMNLASKWGTVTSASILTVAGGTSSYVAQRKYYKPNIVINLNSSNDEDTYPNNQALYDYYLMSGDRFYLYTLFSNQNVRYELEIHLYKKP